MTLLENNDLCECLGELKQKLFRYNYLVLSIIHLYNILDIRLILWNKYVIILGIFAYLIKLLLVLNQNQCIRLQEVLHAFDLFQF